MKQLPLHQRHESLGAKFGEFSGFQMPLYYAKPIEEHLAVRRRAGVFDISHMGQFIVRGDSAQEFLGYAMCNDVRGMKDGDALYTPMLREDGGVLDDLIVYRHDPAHYRIIANAGTRENDFEWLDCLADDFNSEFEDVSDKWCLLAVQGPDTFSLLASHCDTPPGKLAYYGFAETKVFGIPAFLARTGYTGEPGCEIAVSLQQAGKLWDHLQGDLGISPIGLAARDTLRLEACMSLYGHELREEWHPYESGLGWAVHLDGGDFIGKKALQAILGVGYPTRLVAIEMNGRGIPREGYPVLGNGKEIGKITSGVLSPTTGKSIALAHIRAEHAKIGSKIQVRIRDNKVDAEVVRKPFYKNPHLRK